MNLKILTAAVLLATPVLASEVGVCIVCPLGYDCSTGKPTLAGSPGQVWTRTADMAEWRDLEDIPAFSWENIYDKPTIPSTAEEVGAAASNHTHPKIGLGICLGGTVSACSSTGNISDNRHCYCYRVGVDGTFSNIVLKSSFSYACSCFAHCPQICAEDALLNP
jgi:hypothetical protein